MPTSDISVITRGGIKTAFMEMVLSLMHIFDPTGKSESTRRNRKNRLQKNIKQ